MLDPKMSISHPPILSAEPHHVAQSSPPTPKGHSAAVVGLQWGDEGKGKIVDLLAGGFDAVVRYNGGSNAGHSVVVDGNRHAFHLMPSGIFHPNVTGVIAPGVVVDPWLLIEEIERARQITDRTPVLALSNRAHVVMPYHKLEDECRERALAPADSRTDRSIGTTKRGIGPAYADKAHRATAIRVSDLIRGERLRERITRICDFKKPQLAAMGADVSTINVDELFTRASEASRSLSPFVTDTTVLLHDMIRTGKSLLFEGANATLLDIDHGTYPFVTSSSTTALGIGPGAGIHPKRISRTIGVAKAYSTRVGAGPFPTELVDDIGDRIRERGREYGTTTGRPRRCGWLDLVALRYAVMLNAVDAVALTLLDVLSGFDSIQVCTSYTLPSGATTDHFVPDAADLADVVPVYHQLPGFREDISTCQSWDDLPHTVHELIHFIERFISAPVQIVSVGPDRTQTIMRQM